jgi:hypothetical protein
MTKSTKVRSYLLIFADITLSQLLPLRGSQKSKVKSQMFPASTKGLFQQTLLKCYLQELMG